jgi:hypothetical protein
MMHTILSLLLGVFLLTGLAACGGADGSDVPSEDGEAARTAVDVTAAETPEEVGEAVGDLYVTALRETSEALDDRPEPAVATERLQQIKAHHVEQLVALGRKIEAMSPAERSTVESAVRQAQSGLSYDEALKPIWADYQAAQQHYIDSGGANDATFWKLLQSVNVITQYAFFDLLRRQAPDEAARLGV